MQRILKAGRAEQTLNKSRFVAEAVHCADEREVMRFLRGLAQQHPHAHHLAFAYRLRNPEGRGVLIRFHDAGEPSGTAGKPILQYLEGRDMINACIAVVRYYGGVNLGTGGLARAYGGTAKLALEAAVLGPYVDMATVRLSVSYPQLEGLLRDVERVQGAVLDKKFGEGVEVSLSLPASAVSEIQKKYQGR